VGVNRHFQASEPHSPWDACCCLGDTVKRKGLCVLACLGPVLLDESRITKFHDYVFSNNYSGACYLLYETVSADTINFSSLSTFKKSSTTVDLISLAQPLRLCSVCFAYSCVLCVFSRATVCAVFCFVVLLVIAFSCF